MVNLFHPDWDLKSLHQLFETGQEALQKTHKEAMTATGDLNSWLADNDNSALYNE